MLLPQKQATPLSHTQSALIEELYQRHWLTLLIAIRRQISSKEEAEDILLEVFLAAFETPALLSMNEQRQLAWLRRVANNKCVDRKRHRMRHPAWPFLEEAEDSLLDDDLLSPEQVALRQEEVGVLRKHLSSLPELQQEILILRFAEGLRCREIAARLDRSESAIRTMLSRTLTLLRSIYGKRTEDARHA
jgi:RNA polymerase sigma-70 factor (ECF subfamily)